MNELLRVNSVSKYFVGLAALKNVDLAVREHEILGLIGPNGAGKTTLFNVITGVYPPSAGDVRWQGRVIARAKKRAAWLTPFSLAGLVSTVAIFVVLEKRGFSLGGGAAAAGGVAFAFSALGLTFAPRGGLRADQIARLGLYRTFQNINLFDHLSVLENAEVGGHRLGKSAFFDAAVTSPRHRRDEKHVRAEAEEAIAFVGLSEKSRHLANALAYGQQRRLEIARALCSKPRLLLLDEPAAGLNPTEKNELMDLVRRIRDAGVTVLLIEHDMKLVMNVCDHIVVLDHGDVIAEGTPSAVQRNPRVVEAYLGKKPAGRAA